MDRKPSPRWSPEHVGMVRYSSYWGKYSLVLHVDGFWVTELDGFAGVNQHPTNAQVRNHCTPPEREDKFLTVAEFYAQVIESKAPAGIPSASEDTEDSRI